MSHHHLVLANGKRVHLLSWQSFTLTEISEHLRPTPKVSRFRVALPWILLAIVLIGLGVSLYFNWDQHQTITTLRDRLAGYEDGYRELGDDLQSCQDAKSDLQEDLYTMTSNRDELVGKLEEISGVMKSTKDTVSQLNDDAFNLWYDSYYYDDYADTSDLASLAEDTKTLDDLLDNEIYQLDNYLYLYQQ